MCLLDMNKISIRSILAVTVALSYLDRVIAPLGYGAWPTPLVYMFYALATTTKEILALRQWQFHPIVDMSLQEVWIRLYVSGMSKLVNFLNALKDIKIAYILLLLCLTVRPLLAEVWTKPSSSGSLELVTVAAIPLIESARILASKLLPGTRYFFFF
jgi:hypothetical protein